MPYFENSSNQSVSSPKHLDIFLIPESILHSQKNTYIGERKEGRMKFYKYFISYSLVIVRP